MRRYQGEVKFKQRPAAPRKLKNLAPVDEILSKGIISASFGIKYEIFVMLPCFEACYKIIFN